MIGDERNSILPNTSLQVDGSDGSPLELKRCLGHFDPRRRRYGLPSAFWPELTRLAVKRLQRTAVPVSNLAWSTADDPQRRYVSEVKGHDRECR